MNLYLVSGHSSTGRDDHVVAARTAKQACWCVAVARRMHMKRYHADLIGVATQRSEEPEIVLSCVDGGDDR